MSKKLWKQVGGDVHPKDYGATLALVEGDHVDIVRIEPDGDKFVVTSAGFYKSDLKWGGKAHPEQMAGSMDFTKEQWEETDIADQGAIAMDYHGSGWSGEVATVSKWSHALPAKSNQIKWWR